MLLGECPNRRSHWLEVKAMLIVPPLAANTFGVADHLLAKRLSCPFSARSPNR